MNIGAIAGAVAGCLGGSYGGRSGEHYSSGKAGVGVKGPCGQGARHSEFDGESLEQLEKRLIVDGAFNDNQNDVWYRRKDQINTFRHWLESRTERLNSKLLRPLVRIKDEDENWNLRDVAANVLAMYPIDRFDEAGLKKFRPEFSVEDTLKTGMFNNSKIRECVRYGMTQEFERYAHVRRVKELETPEFPMVFRYAIPKKESSMMFRYVFPKDDLESGTNGEEVVLGKECIGIAREDFDYIKNYPLGEREEEIDKHRYFTTYLYVLKREDYGGK